MLVIVPEQERLPFELVMVQPVAADPPAILTSTAPSPWRLSPVSVAARVPPWAKVTAVADTAMVSSVATPVRSPVVETFNPPLEVRAKVPVELPIATLPVPVVAIVTFDAPALAKSVAPVEIRVVNLPVDGVVAPIVVPLIVPPVAVKVPAVMLFEALLKVKALA